MACGFSLNLQDFPSWSSVALEQLALVHYHPTHPALHRHRSCHHKIVFDVAEICLSFHDHISMLKLSTLAHKNRDIKQICRKIHMHYHYLNLPIFQAGTTMRAIRKYG